MDDDKVSVIDTLIHTKLTVIFRAQVVFFWLLIQLPIVLSI